MKDWNGNKASVKHLLGVNYKTNTTADRETRDYYATGPKAVRLLMERLQLPKDTWIWECACGEGHLSEELRKMGYTEVQSTDIVNRGYKYQHSTFDFLQPLEKEFMYAGSLYFEQTDFPMSQTCILTNPPYKYANEFILHALELLPDGGWCCMLLNLNQLAGKTRYEKIYREQPPLKVYVFTGRIQCAKNADFAADKGNGAINYAWFVWRKGSKQPTTIEWIEC